jgi:hypothetical protein
VVFVDDMESIDVGGNAVIVFAAGTMRQTHAVRRRTARNPVVTSYAF